MNLHNVKDPSSRLLRWRLRMEEYDYDIKYVKGKENKVADCLSRLFSANDNDILRQTIANAELNLDSGKTSKERQENMERNLQEIKPTGNRKSTIIEDRILEDKEEIKILTEKYGNPRYKKGPRHRAIPIIPYTAIS